MDLAFWLVESQTKALDTDLSVADLLDFNKLVSDAKMDSVDIVYQSIPLESAIVVAIGDSSFGNVGKNKTASQAGLIVLIADGTDENFMEGRPAKMSPMVWRSHRVKRVVRSTLAAETMAALEAVEAADVIRAHMVELMSVLTYKDHTNEVAVVPMAHLTDCKSLWDLLQKQGQVPSERRLLMDIEALRSDIENHGVKSFWINTKQMLADCMTKNDPRCGDYLRYVLRTGFYQRTEDKEADRAIWEQRCELKGRRGEFYRNKLWKKMTKPSDQCYDTEGHSYYAGATAEVKFNPQLVSRPPQAGLRWRRVLGQAEGSTMYQELEEAADTHGLKEKIR